MNMRYKICTKCRKNKNIKFFVKDKSMKNGLRSSCKDCRKEHDKKQKIKPPGLKTKPTKEEYDLLKKLIGNTPESAYALGYLWADGHIPFHTSAVELKCVRSDIDDIRNIFEYSAGWRYVICNSKSNNSNKKPLAKLTISNRAFHEWLLKHDFHIKSGTSPDKLLKAIPKEYHNIWLRGYFDGDGSLYLAKKNSAEFSFSSVYGQDWEFMNHFSTGIVTRIKRVARPKSNGESKWRTNKKSHIYNLIEKIYINQESKIGLARKSKKFDEFISAYKA